MPLSAVIEAKPGDVVLDPFFGTGTTGAEPRPSRALDGKVDSFLPPLLRKLVNRASSSSSSITGSFGHKECQSACGF